MAPNLSLFGRTKQLELQIDSFFDKVSEAAVVFRLGVRVYLKEGYTEEFVTRLDRVVELESEADVLRRDIEKHLYSNTLIPDSRGDVLGLIETMDQLLSEFEDTLWAFSIEKPAKSRYTLPTMPQTHTVEQLQSRKKLYTLNHNELLLSKRQLGLHQLELKKIDICEIENQMVTLEKALEELVIVNKDCTLDIEHNEKIQLIAIQNQKVNAEKTHLENTNGPLSTLQENQLRKPQHR